jgi:two-component system sensor histidine kinase PrrB
MKLSTRTGLAALGAAVIAIALLANVVTTRVEVALRDRVDEVLVTRAETSAAVLVAVGDRIAVSELNAVIGSARIAFGDGSSGTRIVEVGPQPPGDLPTVAGSGLRTVDVGDESWRLFAVTVDDVPEVGDRAVVEFAEPLGAVQERIRETRRRLVVAGLLAAIGAGALGWLAGRRAARPLTRLQHDVAALRSDARSRLTVADDYGTPEVDDVAAALNESLGDLDDAREQREAALAAAREFAAAATHELRTPLQSAMTNLDVALMAEAPGESVTAARSELSRMASSLAAVQALSQADLARPEWFESLDLGALGDLIDEVTSRSSVELVVEQVTAGSPIHRIWPDGVRLAVDNVVRNAVTHGRSADGTVGRVVVTVGVDGDVAVLTVDDDGPGISEADRVRVVSAFERGSTDVPGSGLGLAVAERVARAHGGTLSLGSGPLGGTRVRIELGDLTDRR